MVWSDLVWYGSELRMLLHRKPDVTLATYSNELHVLLQGKLPPAAADPNTQRFLASVKAHNLKTPPSPPVLPALPALPVLPTSSPAFYSAHASGLYFLAPGTDRCSAVPLCG